MGTVERRTWWKGTETRPLCFFWGIVSELTAFFLIDCTSKYKNSQMLKGIF